MKEDVSSIYDFLVLRVAEDVGALNLCYALHDVEELSVCVCLVHSACKVAENKTRCRQLGLTNSYTSRWLRLPSMCRLPHNGRASTTVLPLRAVVDYILQPLTNLIMTLPYLMSAIATKIQNPAICVFTNHDNGFFTLRSMSCSDVVAVSDAVACDT